MNVLKRPKKEKDTGNCQVKKVKLVVTWTKNIISFVLSGISKVHMEAKFLKMYYYYFTGFMQTLCT